MTNQQAAAKAKKRWGKQAYIRAGQSFSDGERRGRASTTLREARAEVKHIDEEITRRLSECDWYQELRQQRRELTKQISDTQGSATYYKFSVGRFNGWANEIIGWGDTWEEAFAMADKRVNSRAA